MACKIVLLHLRIRHALARLIHPGVEEGLDLQPRGSRGATDSTQHGIPRAQGCARPMQAARAAQAMLHRMPLRAARRIMTHGDRQPEAVAPLSLPLVLSRPGAYP